MRTSQLLVIVTAIGSALCWLPNSMEPSLDLWWWSPLVVVALLAAISTSQAHRRWVMFCLASAIGTFAGLCLGIAIWPSPGSNCSNLFRVRSGDGNGNIHHCLSGRVPGGPQDIDQQWASAICKLDCVGMLRCNRPGNDVADTTPSGSKGGAE